MKTEKNAVKEPESVVELLDLTARAADGQDRVSVKRILEILGRCSFGSVVLIAGLITVSPVIGIPGLPTVIGLLLVLIALQLLLKRDHPWLPGWILRRSIRKNRFCWAIRWLQPVARFLDRFTKRRLILFTSDTSQYPIGIACILLGGAMPFLEIIPFSSNAIGIPLSALGLSLVARDGLFALLAFLYIILAIFGLVIGIAYLF
jgi:hypothetical protein